MIINYYEKHDFIILARHFERYYLYKEKLESNELKLGVATNVKIVVEGIETIFNNASDEVKKIIKMSWLDKENDDVICKMLGIVQKRLNSTRKKLLIDFAEEIGYV